MPKNVENFEIRTLGRDDYAQAAEIFAFVHALHQANRPDIYRKTNVPLGEAPRCGIFGADGVVVQ